MLKILFYLVVGIIAFLLLFEITMRMFRKHLKFLYKFSAVRRYFDSPMRKFMYPPKMIVKRIVREPALRVLEIGCGSGAYATEVLRETGVDSKLYAIDTNPDMLKLFREKMSNKDYHNISNLEIKNDSAYALPFGDDSFDLVYMVCVLQELHETEKVMKEVKRVLKTNGIFAVTECLEDFDYVTIGKTKKILEDYGFNHKETLGNFWSYTVRVSK
jgi:ubiquinone/menaquinone biosynthesis C-methylase UbiE